MGSCWRTPCRLGATPDERCMLCHFLNTPINDLALSSHTTPHACGTYNGQYKSNVLFQYYIGTHINFKASKLYHKVSLCITARLYCWQVRLRTILVDSGMVINDSHLGTVLTPFDFLIVKPAWFFVEMPFEFTPFEVFLLENGWQSSCWLGKVQRRLNNQNVQIYYYGSLPW